MLYNKEEISLMSNAIQQNMRKKVLVEPFQHIVQDFFTADHFQGKHVVDLCPGQCDFLDIAKRCGAITYGVDFDPCVTQLGKLRGHNMADAQNFQESWPYEQNMFDGIFCRGSLNYFTTIKDGPQDASAVLARLFSSLKPDGWIWIAPWAKFSQEQTDISDKLSPDLSKSFSRYITPFYFIDLSVSSCEGAPDAGVRFQFHGSLSLSPPLWL